MAQSKQDLIDQASKLGLEVNEKLTMPAIKELIAGADKNNSDQLKEHAETEVKLAKAGKRSAKAVKEAEEIQAKKERIQNTETTSELKPAAKLAPTRTRLERKGKNFKVAAAKIEKDKAYTIDEAIELAKTTSPVKFDASVELHVNLNVDPRQADQNIRDNLILPAGSGKKIRLAVLTDDPKVALEAGADIAGNEEFLQQLDKGKLDFDVLIASPSLMAKLGKYARVLGPRGLMPNPKSGTVTNDIAKAVKDSKGGKVEYRVDSNGIVHLSVGKVSFQASDLRNNIDSIIKSIKSNKPSSVKSNYLKAIHLATSMGPSITVEISSLI